MATVTLWKNKEKKEVDPYLFSITANELAAQIDQDGRNQKEPPTQAPSYAAFLMKLPV